LESSKFSEYILARMDLHSSYDKGDLEFTDISHAGASRDLTGTRNTCHLIFLSCSQSHVYFMFFSILLLSGELDTLQCHFIFVAASSIDQLILLGSL